MSAHETAEAILLVIKRIAKWLFFGAMLVTAVITSLYGGKILLIKYEDRPRLVTSIGDVTLGDKLNDVLFRQPDFKQEIDYEALAKQYGGVQVAPTKPPDWSKFSAEDIKAIREGDLRKVSDAGLNLLIAAGSRSERTVSTLDGKVENKSIRYTSKSSSRVIEIEGGHVTLIGYLCNERSDYTSIGGIECGASGDAVFNRFKSAVKVQCLRDKSDPDHFRYRAYDVENFGVRYVLESNRVYQFVVMPPSIIATATGVSWGNCE